MSLPALPVPVSAQGLHRQQSQSVPGPQGETCAGKMNSMLWCEDKWGQNCYFVRIAPMSTLKVSCVLTLWMNMVALVQTLKCQ